jgi:hypothetical protein
MDSYPDTSTRPSWGWLWWALALPLAVTVVGGLAVEYMKPDREPAGSGPQGGHFATGERTYQFWCEANRAQQRQVRIYTTQSKGTREEVVGMLTATAESVEGLPSRGVDADAIEAAHGLAESMRRLASFLRQNSGQDDAVPATVETLLFGDAGAFKDQAADARQLRSYLEESAARARKMRALLSSRYDREFPALEATPTKHLKQPTDPTITVFHITRELSKAPPEVELMRLQQEVAALDEAAEDTVSALARARVEENELRREVAALSEKADRENDPARKKALAAELDARRKLLAARADVIGTLQQRLSAIQEQKREFQALRTEMETSLEALRLLGKGDNVLADPDALRGIRERMEELQRRLELEEKKLDLQRLGQ